ncbi:MAG: tetratricopeptide repeat protein, partial [Nitrospirae bacterium]|nr:tetratricopeptide repeat protein [Nitrospirota bacterium]
IIAFVSAVFYLVFRFSSFILQPSSFPSRHALRITVFLLAASVVVLSFASYQRNAVWKDEISLWTDVVSKSPNKARGYNGLGLAYKKLKQYAEAIEQFRKAARLDSKNAEAHYNLGNTYKDLGFIDNALTEYQTALTIDPNIAEIHLSFANVLKNKGLIDEAIEHYKSAIKLQPDFTEAHNYLGFAYYYHKRQFNEALEEYQVALKQDPRNAATHLNLGIVYKSMGQPDKAAEHFNIARGLNPSLYETKSSHP